MMAQNWHKASHMLLAEAVYPKDIDALSYSIISNHDRREKTYSGEASAGLPSSAKS